MTKKFLRRTWDRYVKLGKGRKKKQKWRRPTGRDNKMREKRKNRPAVVAIGYKGSEKEKRLVVNNLNELKKIKKDEIAVIGNVGKKKKIEIVKVAKEKGIKISNLNLKKFLKDVEKKEKQKEAKKITKKEKVKKRKSKEKKETEKKDSEKVKKREQEEKNESVK